MGTAAARALSARGRVGRPARTLHARERPGQHRGDDPQLPAHVPRPALRPDGPARAGGVAGAGRRGGTGAAPSGRRHRRRRGDRGVGARTGGRRRAVRTPLGRRGRRAMADAAVPAELALPLPGRRRHPAIQGSRPGAGRRGGRSWGGRSGRDARRVDRGRRGRRRGGDRRGCDPSAGRDRGGRLVDGLPPRAGRGGARVASDPRADDVLRHGSARPPDGDRLGRDAAGAPVHRARPVPGRTDQSRRAPLRPGGRPRRQIVRGG